MISGEKLVSFEDLLNKNNIYNIPIFQRDYAWKKENIIELFDDLKSISVQCDDDSHFMGIIFICNKREDKNKRVILDLIDGQQRIVTLIMSLLEIKEQILFQEETFIENGLKKKEIKLRITAINSMVSYSDSLSGNINGYKIEMNKNNDKFFKKYIIEVSNDNKKRFIELRKEINGRLEKGEKDLNKNILYAKKEINKQIEDMQQDKIGIERYKVLTELQEKIQRRLKFIVLEVSKEADAYTFFETLNERGIELTAANLIKNRIFKNIQNIDKQKLDSYLEAWDEMAQTGNMRFSNYIRYMLSYKIGYFKKNKLFELLKNEIEDDSIKTQEFLDSLNENFELYSFLNDTKNIISKKYKIYEDKKFKSIIEKINKFGYEVIKAPILKILLVNKKFLDDKKSEEYKEVIKLTEFLYKVFVRHISIAKRKVQNIEKTIYEFGKDGDIKNLIEECRKNIMDDAELEGYMKVMQVKFKEPIIYELLCVFEINKKTPSHIENLYDRSVITVEHILPQTIDISKDEGKSWISEFGSIDGCKEYCQRLGNLTLLDYEKQNKASNKEFIKKKEVYKLQSDIETTKSIYQYSKWGVDEINNRQEEMAKVYIDEYKLTY